MQRSRLGICGALVSVLAALGACAHDDSQAMPPQTAYSAPAAMTSTTPAPSDATTSQSTSGASTGQQGMSGQQPQPATDIGAGVGATNQQSSPPSDEDIAAIIEAINKSEVDAGKLAKSKAQSADVKSFAAMMVNDHTTALQQETALATKEHLTPNASNGTCQSLTTNAQQEADSLQQKSGPDFDRAYMDAMVQGHQKALGMLDDTLIPSAKDAQLKAHLMSLRTHVEMHLRKATAAQQRLSGTDASPQPSRH